MDIIISVFCGCLGSLGDVKAGVRNWISDIRRGLHKDHRQDVRGGDGIHE